MDVTKVESNALCQAVEQAMGKRLQTHKYFDLMSERVYARTGEMVSRNTLRRVWGKLDEERTPHRSTLSILARFIGYSDFDAFANSGTTGAWQGRQVHPSWVGG